MRECLLDCYQLFSFVDTEAIFTALFFSCKQYLLQLLPGSACMLLFLREFPVEPLIHTFYSLSRLLK